jgi:hypothetical protein
VILTSKKQRLFIIFGNKLPYSFVEITVQSPVTYETQFRPRMEMAVFDLSGFNPASENVFGCGPNTTGWLIVRSSFGFLNKRRISKSPIQPVASQKDSAASCS